MQTRAAVILTAILLILGAVLANVAFIGLGSVFNYPDILQSPTEEIFQKFNTNQGMIITWFLLLALGAGLLAPIAILIARLFPSPLSRLTMWLGVAAAVVQVIGLLRWPLIVPGLIAGGDTAKFEFFHTLLGSIVGETSGYLLTGLWTILLLIWLRRVFAASWFVWFGNIAAGLILLGVLIPLGVPGADMANFIGYVLWSLWLITFAVLLLRKPHAKPVSTKHL